MIDLLRSSNGRTVEYQDEQWVVVYDSYSHDDIDYYLAVKLGTPLPAPISLIGVKRKSFAEALRDEAAKKDGGS